MNKPDDLVPSIARNELFYFFARVCMIIATLFGAPIMLWLLGRVVTQNDALAQTVIQQNVDIKLLSSRVDERLTSDLRQLTDHELRLRTLERAK